MKNRKLSDKVRILFNADNIDVIECGGNNRIEVYYYQGNGKTWIPYAGGPLYNQDAKDEMRRIAKGIEEFRSMLPKKIRDYPIVKGRIETNTFPGKFLPE